MKYDVTITDIYATDLEKKLALLPKDKVLARLVVDTLSQDFVDAAVLISKYATPVIQCCDSYIEGTMSDDDYVTRLNWIKDKFSDYEYFETGNEVNGDFCSKNILKRMQYVSAMFSKKTTAMTLFYQSGVEQWWEQNKVPCTHLWLSFYPRCMSDFKGVPAVIKNLGIERLGEIGMNEWTQKQRPTMQVYRNATALGIPWNAWNFQSETKLLQGAI